MASLLSSSIRRLSKQASALLPALTLTVSLQASPAVTITSPVDGAVFHPGQTMIVTVDATPLAFKTVGVAGKLPLGFSKILYAPPYRFLMKIPPNIDPGPYTLIAVGVLHSGEAVHSPWVRVAIERPDSPLRIESDLHTLILDYIGESIHLVVEGTFADGSKISLTRSTFTKYESDTPDVVTVDAHGIAVAISPGSAKIKITNRSATTVIPVTVASGRRR